MAGRIPSQFIDELLARVDIVDVIDARVPLKKAGREYSACCPFHNEKTPSFTVSAEKQFSHCFGCGAHGSAISFLMEYEHLGFVEAVEELASMAGLQVPREAGKEGAHDDSNHALYDVLEKVAGYYRQQLRRRPQADHATEYLKKRGLTGEIASAFELGYAPPGWDNLVPALAGQGVSREHLLQAGMLIAKDGGGTYDRFRDRVMFPIRDRRGRVIGFGGRQLGNDDGPKYLNSPETPIFHKGSELYGLYQARKAVRKLERLLVVEGYMDVVALTQFGVQNAVATLGTATTHEHVERLFRVVPRLVFCFDGDRAGRQAAWRALENALPVLGEGRRIDFMFLPEGEDPDTLVRKEGREAFEARMSEARPFSDFFFEALCKLVDVSTIEGRDTLVKQARPLLEKLPEGVFRHMMTARLAEIAHIDRGALGISGGAAADMAHQHRDFQRSGRESGSAGSPVRHMIRLLLQRPSLVAMLNEDDVFASLELPGVPLLRALVELLRKHPHMSCGAILEHWRDREEGKHLAKLARLPLAVPEEGLESELLDTQDALVKLREEQVLDRLIAKPLGELTDEEKHKLKQVFASRGNSET
jgi:DNA primase